jgi:hypothetical protein
MRRIWISEDVWNAIAERGKFGEKEDDVLRREFRLPPNAVPAAFHPASAGRRGRGDKRYAIKRMSTPIEGGQFIVRFDDGSREQWMLPAKSDKDAIRKIRDAAVKFARAHGASHPGQTNAVMKALTNAGYHLTK